MRPGLLLQSLFRPVATDLARIRSSSTGVPSLGARSIGAGLVAAAH
jgi:hypothetical protein